MRFERLDLVRERLLPLVGDGPGTYPDRPHVLDLLAGRIEKRPLFARIPIEVCKRLAVAALRDQRQRARRRRPRLEAAEARLDIREPVAPLGVFAFVDEIEAERALLAHDRLD